MLPLKTLAFSVIERAHFYIYIPNGSATYCFFMTGHVQKRGKLLSRKANLIFSKTCRFFVILCHKEYSGNPFCGVQMESFEKLIVCAHLFVHGGIRRLRRLSPCF